MSTFSDFDFELHADERELKARSSTGESIDENIELLKKYDNRIGINSIAIKQHPSDTVGQSLLDVCFNLLAHAHPECNFEWIRLIVNATDLPDALIKDFSPREEKGEHPVKYTTTYKKGLSFEISKLKVGPELVKKTSTEHEVYFARIIGTGINTPVVQWTFEREPHTNLHFDNTLRLLLTHAKTADAKTLRFSVSAKVQMKGWLGLIPLVGKKVVELNSFF